MCVLLLFNLLEVPVVMCIDDLCAKDRDVWFINDLFPCYVSDLTWLHLLSLLLLFNLLEVPVVMCIDDLCAKYGDV